MLNDRDEWLEIIEPITHKTLFVNVETGECLCYRPSEKFIKNNISEQWWELFDDEHGQVFYYNATTKCTSWDRPVNADIIPIQKIHQFLSNRQTKIAEKSSSTATSTSTSTATAIATTTTDQQTQTDFQSRKLIKVSKIEPNHHHRSVPVCDFDESFSSLSLKSDDDLDACSYDDSTKSISNQNFNLLNKSSTSSNVHQLLKRPQISFDLTKFALDNLNLERKSAFFFRKRISVQDLLTWTNHSIRRPMLATNESKMFTKQAIEMFRFVQIYMGDRKLHDQIVDVNQIAVEIIQIAFSKPILRDELYVQLYRQTCENPHVSSLILGWELMAICLAYVPPSTAFEPILLNYLQQHIDDEFQNSTSIDKFNENLPCHLKISFYAFVCVNRLRQIGWHGQRAPRKPSADDIIVSRNQIFKVSLFGTNLEQIMLLQKLKWPDLQIPWPQFVLCKQILDLKGLETEGIFRVSADVDEMTHCKSQLDQWNVIEASDAHVPANLLKLFFRELAEPLIPTDMYETCVANDLTTERILDLVRNHLPPLNRTVLVHLIEFLQQFNDPAAIQVTKMDAANLSMVFAPNCLRCPSSDPQIIFNNARKEMLFIRNLLESNLC